MSRGLAPGRRAARALVWLAGLFVAGQLALAAVVELDLAPARDPLEAAKWRRLDALRADDPGRSLLLMLGSSRALQGFRPDLCDGPKVRGFNFGLTAAGPLREWMIYQRLRCQGVRPALLLVEVMPALLQEPGTEQVSEEGWLVPEQLAGADLARLWPYLDEPGRVVRCWLSKRLVPAVSYRRAWCEPLGLAGPELPTLLAEMNDRGWQPLRPENVPADQREALTRAQLSQYASTLRSLRVGAGPAQALRDMLATARADGVPAVLVLMPEGSAFRAAYGPGAGPELRGLLVGLGVRLIDAREWLPDEAFWDGHHLLPGAAVDFTRRLRAELAETRYGG